MIPTSSILRIGALHPLAAVAQAAYTIEDSYDRTNFFENFEFFNTKDPTNGFVKYQSAVEANQASLAGYVNNGIYLGADFSNQNPTTGLGSVRVISNKNYTHGLVITDIAHMPSSTKNGCGVWPAVWMTAEADWPKNGEIDILEGVNSNTANTITIHTSEGCSFRQGNCQGSSGCGQTMKDTSSYGAGFNAIGGGVYAMEWTSAAIKVFWFPRIKIPADITAGKPNPQSWTPATVFSGNECDIDKHFTNQKIIFNIDFCGDWAGKAFATDAKCSSLAATCDDYVAKNPADFKDAYFLVNSVKFFSEAGVGKRDSTGMPNDV